MPGLFIARRYFVENGETKPVDYHFDTMEKANNFINGVRSTTPLDHGHEFDLLTHKDNEVILLYSTK